MVFNGEEKSTSLRSLSVSHLELISATENFLQQLQHRNSSRNCESSIDHANHKRNDNNENNVDQSDGIERKEDCNRDDFKRSFVLCDNQRENLLLRKTIQQYVMSSRDSDSSSPPQCLSSSIPPPDSSSPSSGSIRVGTNIKQFREGIWPSVVSYCRCNCFFAMRCVLFIILE